MMISTPMQMSLSAAYALRRLKHMSTNTADGQGREMLQVSYNAQHSPHSQDY